MIHVDYPDNGPGWVLLNPETGNKCTAYHVLFDEAFALRVPKPRVSDFQDLFFYDPGRTRTLIENFADWFSISGTFSSDGSHIGYDFISTSDRR